MKKLAIKSPKSQERSTLKQTGKVVPATTSSYSDNLIDCSSENVTITYESEQQPKRKLALGPDFPRHTQLIGKEQQSIMFSSLDPYDRTETETPSLKRRVESEESYT